MARQSSVTIIKLITTATYKRNGTLALIVALPVHRGRLVQKQ